MESVLLVHAAATWAMVGLIWFVQLVHYPLFAGVGEASFVTYEAGHTRRTTWVVALFMPVEALTATWLTIAAPAGVHPGVVAAGLVLVASLWITTAVWQAPMHGSLSLGYDAHVQKRLVATNWVRTGLWSIRGGLVLVMLGQAMA
ncbi:MAG: hypothetical protein HKN80_15315 [Acidimicrobiia bacterium]|nr:hypothetical protein [Acidimicrobiia bacterium]